MAIIHGNEQEFENLIKGDLVIVDFFAEWCGPCRMLGPVLEEISEDYKIIKIDVDKNPNLAQKFGIMSVPTIIKFRNENEADKILGFLPKDELIEWINK